MSFFISPAYADATAPSAQASGGDTVTLIMMVGMVVLFYFFLIRPQSKRAKEHKQLLEIIAKGDEVVTNGGILGKVTKVVDEFVVIEVSAGQSLRVQKAAVISTLPKGTIKEIDKGE